METNSNEAEVIREVVTESNSNDPSTTTTDNPEPHSMQGDNANLTQPELEERLLLGQCDQQDDVAMQQAETQNSEEVAKQEREEERQMLLKEKARLAQIVFNQREELHEIRAKLLDVSSRNSSLTEQLTQNADDLTSREHRYRLLETMRDELALKKSQAEELATQYQRQKEDRDQVVRSLLREKSQMNEDLVATRQKLRDNVQEVASLVAEKKSWERERREVCFELEKLRNEVEVLTNNKKWLLAEVTERDTRIAQLRIEMGNRAIAIENEKLNFSNNADVLNERIVDLEAEIRQLQHDALEKEKQFHSELFTKSESFAQAEREIAEKTRIIGEYRMQLDEASKIIETFRADQEQENQQIQDVRAELDKVITRLQNQNEEHTAELSAKDKELETLRDEVKKANDLLRNRDTLDSVSEAELELIAPRAAATRRLMTSGLSLVQIYSEHCRVVGELEEQKVLNKQFEKELQEIVAEIEMRVPDLTRQKTQLDRLLHHNDELQAQLERARNENKELEAKSNSTIRELTFTRIELEKFQREHTKLQQHTAALLYAVEVKQRNEQGGPPASTDEEHDIYLSIANLQKKNVDLQLQLEDAVMNVQNSITEAIDKTTARMQERVNTMSEEIVQYKNEIKGLKTCLESAEQQRDHYKKLAEIGMLDPEAQVQKQAILSLKQELATAQGRVGMLDKRVSELSQERDQAMKLADERVEHLNSRLHELEIRRTALACELEMQKQVAANAKSEFNKQLSKQQQMTQEIERARSAAAASEAKLIANNETLVNQQDEIATLRVSSRVAGEELMHAKSVIARLEGEIKAHTEMSKTHQSLIAALNGAERRLQLGEDLKISRLEALLESTSAERDQLRITNQNLSEQLSNATRLSSETEKAITTERDLLRAKLEEQKVEKQHIEDQLTQVRTKLTAAQQQAARFESVNVSLNPERLANRNTYLEAQVQELRQKLAENETKLARSEKQLAQLTVASDTVESSLHQHNQNSQAMISKLTQLLDVAKKREEELNIIVNELRDEVQRKTEQHVQAEDAWRTQKVELEQKVAVLEVRITNSDSQCDEVRTRLTTAHNEFSELNAKLIESENSRNAVLAERDSLDASLAAIRTELAETKTELINQKTRVEEAYRDRDAAIQQERVRQSELEKSTTEMSEALNASKEKIEELMTKMTSFSNEYAIIEASIRDGKPIEELVISEESMQTMNSTIRYYREENAKAQERAMNAEIAQKRLRAEAEEMRAERERMADIVRQRTAEAEANKAALAQKVELQNRLQKFQATMNENKYLKSELSKLTTTNASLTARLDSLGNDITKLQEEKSLAEQNAAAANALASSRQAEVEAARKRVGETAQERLSKLNASAVAAHRRAEKVAKDLEIEKVKLEEAKKSLTEAEKKTKIYMGRSADAEKRLQATVNLARRLKEERDELKSTVDSRNDDTPEGIATRERQQIKTLNEEIERLNKRVEAETSEITTLRKKVANAESEAQEAMLRATSMQHMVTKTKERIEDLSKALEQEKEAHARTKAEASLHHASPTKTTSASFVAPTLPAQSVPQQISSVPAAPTGPKLPTPTRSMDTVPSAPSSSKPTESHPMVPVAQTQSSVFSVFSNPTPHFRPSTTPASAAFGSATLFQPQTHAAGAPQKPLDAPSTPQSSSPTPSVPVQETAKVATFFGLRQTGPRSSTFAGAPADPAPAAASNTFQPSSFATSMTPAQQRAEEAALLEDQPGPSNSELDLLAADNSQDGLPVAVSSTEHQVARKRAGSISESQESKRMREGQPEEHISSSERSQAEDPEHRVFDDVMEEISVHHSVEDIADAEANEGDDLADQNDEAVLDHAEDENIESDHNILDENVEDGLPEMIEPSDEDLLADAERLVHDVPEHPMQHRGREDEDDAIVLSSDDSVADSESDNEGLLLSDGEEDINDNFEDIEQQDNNYDDDGEDDMQVINEDDLLLQMDRPGSDDNNSGRGSPEISEMYEGNEVVGADQGEEALNNEDSQDGNEDDLLEEIEIEREAAIAPDEDDDEEVDERENLQIAEDADVPNVRPPVTSAQQQVRSGGHQVIKFDMPSSSNESSAEPSSASASVSAPNISRGARRARANVLYVPPRIRGDNQSPSSQQIPRNLPPARGRRGGNMRGRRGAGGLF